MEQPAKRRVYIPIFEDVELLDFCGPYEVFSTANRILEADAFHVRLLAGKLEPVRTHNGMSVIPDGTWHDAESPEILLIPGGVGARAELNQEAFVDWIGRMAEPAELVLSVCTGALLLAKAGLLEGLSATTHANGFDALAKLAPTASIQRGTRFVDNGKVVTSAGISAGIDMSLHIVRRLYGDPVAQSTSHHMEYFASEQP